MKDGSFVDYFTGKAAESFLLSQWLALVVTAALLFALFHTGHLDRTLTAAFFDSAHHAFPLRSHWLLKSIFHDLARTVSSVAALMVGALAIAARSGGPRALLYRYRHELAFVAIAVLAGAAVVEILKYSSGYACPWDLVEFGGAPTASPAGCFPAAHPLAGYAWVALAFVLYPTSRLAARATLFAVLGLGTALGFVQVARGAHFVSHVLWSAWTVWAVDVTLLTALTLTRIGGHAARAHPSLLETPPTP